MGEKFFFNKNPYSNNKIKNINNWIYNYTVIMSIFGIGNSNSPSIEIKLD